MKERKEERKGRRDKRKRERERNPIPSHTVHLLLGPKCRPLDKSGRVESVRRARIPQRGAPIVTYRRYPSPLWSKRLVAPTYLRRCGIVSGSLSSLRI